MILRALTLAIAFLAPAAVSAAEPPQRFNLNCTIEAAWSSYDGRVQDRTLDRATIDAPFSLRIDLAAKTWCRVDMCNRIGALTAEPGTLSLVGEPRVLMVPKDFIIDRMTGRFVRREHVGGPDGPLAHVTGSCKPAPFTPFPKPMF